MEWYWALCLMFGVTCFGMFAALPVAFAFFAANIVGTYVFLGGQAGLSTMPIEVMQALSTFSLVPIALFVLMGEILFHTGVAMRAIGAIDRMIAKVPGRLSIVSIVGGTIFSSLSGSTIANTAILGKVLLPHMLEQGYHPRIAMGPIMAVGGVAMLIPPSALAVLLASLAEQSISKLLMAGIVPGVMMAALFIVYVVGVCTINPALAPAAKADDVPLRDRFRPFLVDVVPLLAIFGVVVGSILAKAASPTQSAALGVAATVIACACYRALTLHSLKVALIETMKINTMILFIVAASTTFSQVLAVSGGTDGLIGLITSLKPTPFVTLLLMIGVLLFLGCLMDQVSMLLLTLPFFLPLAVAQGIDIMFLLVLILIVMEISLLTPPFGLLLFVMRAVAPNNPALLEIYSAAAPFIAIELFVLALLTTFPAIVMWLPALVP
jgi:tripartite ATP-independent transporter DctM subunit